MILIQGELQTRINYEFGSEITEVIKQVLDLVLKKQLPDNWQITAAGIWTKSESIYRYCLSAWEYTGKRQVTLSIYYTSDDTLISLYAIDMEVNKEWTIRDCLFVKPDRQSGTTIYKESRHSINSVEVLLKKLIS